jgi:hypothetical protein
MVLEEFHEIVHRSGLVPRGPAFGAGGKRSDAAVYDETIQQKGAVAFYEPPLGQPDELGNLASH